MRWSVVLLLFWLSAKAEATGVSTVDVEVLNLQDMDLAASLLLVAEKAKQNIIIAEGISGKITLRLLGVSPEQALHRIIQSQGLKASMQDGILVISKDKEPTEHELQSVKTVATIPQLPTLRTHFFQLKHASAAEIAGFLRGTGQQHYRPSTVIDGFGTMAGIAQRSTVSQTSKDSLLSERGNVNFDERTNTLVVIDTAERLQAISNIIRRLDVRTRQVMIESRVVITSTAFAKSLGTRFRALAGGSTQRQADIADYGYGPFGLGLPGDKNSSGVAMASALAIPNAMGMVDLVLSRGNSRLLGLELTAMQREGKGEILSHPRIMTTDRYPAAIRVGTEIPYQEATGQGNTVTVFKEAVLKLEVTPYIAPSDQITLDLEITKDEPNLAFMVNGEIPINTRAITTRVTVGDGETIVLGGVFERETGSNREQIPGLGSVPVIGKAFGRDGRNHQQSELLVFVTPTIVESPSLPEPEKSTKQAKPVKKSK